MFTGQTEQYKVYRFTKNNQSAEIRKSKKNLIAMNTEAKKKRN